jgi:diacylglycerol kinase (ATP)
VAVTGSPEELDEVLRRHDGRTVVVVGGDGSAHVAVNALARTGLLDEVTLTLVPLGTANDLSTHLGMSSDAVTAADQLLGGHITALDLLELKRGDDETEIELVANAVHVGLGVVAAERATPLKRWLGPVAYPAGAVMAGATYAGRDGTVRIDGETMDLGGPFLAVAVANAPRLGGVEFAPDARPDDGLLDVVAIPARPWRARGSTVMHLARRKATHVHLGRGRVVHLEGDIGPMDADGEHLDAGGPCSIEIKPSAVSVLVPPASDDG